ncbi:unnamed protein product, partial [Didymodactylos carnosus]
MLNRMDSQQIQQVPVVNIKSVDYNSALNCLIGINNKNELFVCNADRLLTVYFQTQSDEIVEIISSHDKCLFITSTHIYARQLYQGLYLLNTIKSINNNNVQIELTLSDAQLLLQFLTSIDSSSIPHLTTFYDYLRQKVESNSASTIANQQWQIITFSYDCPLLIKICSDTIRLSKLVKKQPPPGFVVIGLLYDYLTRCQQQIPENNSGDDADSTSKENSSSESSSFEHITVITPGEITLSSKGAQKPMLSEATRLSTFSLWPHSSCRWLSPEAMAAAGFYYSGLKDNDDRALCFACTVCLVCWEPLDMPTSEHERHSPNCPFVKGEFTENVPIRTTCATQPGKNIYDTDTKWLIKSNELISNRYLLFMDEQWLIRLCDINCVLDIYTLLSFKPVVKKLSEPVMDFDHAVSSCCTISINSVDPITTKYQTALIPLALTMFDKQSYSPDVYLIFCLSHVSNTNTCCLIGITVKRQISSTPSSQTTMLSSRGYENDHQQQPIFPYMYTTDDYHKPTSFYEKSAFIEDEEETFDKSSGGGSVVQVEDDSYSKYHGFSISHFIDLQNKKKKKPTAPSSSPSQEPQPQQIKNIMKALDKTKSNQAEMITDQNDEKQKPDLSSKARDVNLSSPGEDENKSKNNLINIEHMIEISNLKQEPKQGYTYQLTNRKLLIFISTDNFVYSFILKIPLDSSPIKVISADYVCQNESTVSSVCPLFLEDDQDGDFIEEDTTDEELEEEEETTTEILNDTNELGVEFGCRLETRINSEQTTEQRRKCYLFLMKSGCLVLYDAYKSMRKISELNLIGDINNTSQEQLVTAGYVSTPLPYHIEKCVQIRGTETIYVWSHENVYEHNLRDLFPLYFIKHDDKTTTPLVPLLHPVDKQRLSAVSTDDSPQLSTTMPESSVYSLVALRQLLSLTKYEQDSIIFFAQHNQYWIDILSEQQQVNKHLMNEKRHPMNQRLSSSTRTWRLRNCSKESSTTTTIPLYTHIFDIQTTMPCI